ncbi:hypothetical protein AN641_06395 [Candidatus Epulonipiscioides gigas]|nr:hypothetical protein AN641_06395 [Epulopiscium sp. SCG-C07WGA-EpuloA2]
MNALSSLFDQNNSSYVPKVKSANSLFSNFMQSTSRQIEKNENIGKFTSSSLFDNNGYFNYTERALLDDENNIKESDSPVAKEIDANLPKGTKAVLNIELQSIELSFSDGSGFMIDAPEGATGVSMKTTEEGMTFTFYDKNGNEVGFPVSYSYDELSKMGASDAFIAALKNSITQDQDANYDPLQDDKKDAEKRAKQKDATMDKLKEIIKEKEKLGEQNGVQYVDSSKNNYRAPVFKPNTPAYIKQAYYELSQNNYFAS